MDNGATMHLAVSLLPGTADTSPGEEPEFSRLAGLVQRAEAVGLDMVLLADSAPASSSDAANSPVPFEATTLLAALATVTSRIGLVAAASTVAHQPYNLARRFASLDIISHGRAGWHATMAQGCREAANFSRPEGFSDTDFRRRSEEYIGIVQGLWQGWDADALLFDKTGGRFHYPEKMHLLDHKGEFFSVRGPLNVARSPQDTPVLVLSGLSEADLDIAVRTADVILLESGSAESAKIRFDDLKHRATAAGRDPEAVKVLKTISLTPDDGPAAVAERLETQFREKRCDGFNVLLPPQPSALDDFADHILPPLRRRGLVRETYLGTTLRSHLGLAGGGDR
ncbi:LLM class flavin-dependent oxidoreductase [Mesorhizobium japonicum]|nr:MULTISPECIES: LLM class flavin-dependent oxidoreductase [Mesorhizobium]MBE1707798.1 LLM class flavin-dependent oxidoreductase [Mesorhizobium japonicum]MBE1712922.1 LLM class flavin-dependent oxidoreductase [Mesorhizobium japonicum]MUT21450.1 LLM class flavin-dependent oxidoreductase [Mesorhizobium japonicum]MUT26383.1 LLM class flavin-dependent oxidoreductase [Mesorhizobium japonicum]PBB14665.1 LLM class flavin-dependent oxidoreductase [Mesorhizobium loti]